MLRFFTSTRSLRCAQNVSVLGRPRALPSSSTPFYIAFKAFSQQPLGDDSQGKLQPGSHSPSQHARKHTVVSETAPGTAPAGHSAQPSSASPEQQQAAQAAAAAQAAGNARGRVLTIPNLLTTIRLLMAPIIANQILDGEFETAMYSFLAAGALDAADGYIARKFNQSSVLGSFLDPLAGERGLEEEVSTQASLPESLPSVSCCDDPLIALLPPALALPHLSPFPLSVCRQGAAHVCHPLYRSGCP